MKFIFGLWYREKSKNSGVSLHFRFYYKIEKSINL